MTTTNVTNLPAFVNELYGDSFKHAVVQTAAIMERPEYEKDRLQKATELVVAGKVTLLTDDLATVESHGHTYHVNPECTCEDSRRRSLYCKHWLAVELLKRTLQRTGKPANGNGHHAPQDAPESLQPEPQPESQPAAQSQAWAVNEAPASCCLKWAINGLEVMYTMRDTDDEKLFARIGRILPKIEAKLEAQRQARQAEKQAQAQSQPSASTNGKAPTPPPTEDDEHYCNYHETPLRKFTKDGRTWYSHKADDGTWCRGR